MELLMWAGLGLILLSLALCGIGVDMLLPSPHKVYHISHDRDRQAARSRYRY